MSNDTRHPERIYNWLDSHFSIARHYGGITYNGHKYFIDMGDPRQPLVRADVLKREKKAKGKAPVSMRTAERSDERAPLSSSRQHDSSDVSSFAGLSSSSPFDSSSSSDSSSSGFSSGGGGDYGGGGASGDW